MAIELSRWFFGGLVWFFGRFSWLFMENLHSLYIFIGIGPFSWFLGKPPFALYFHRIQTTFRRNS